MPVMAELNTQAVAGVAPPASGEALIRDAWPSVASHPAAAALARRCYQSVILAPIGWIILAPFLLKRLSGALPGLSGWVVRYRLTNRRLSRCKGFNAEPMESVSLDTIRDVRLTSDEVSEYFFAGTLEILGDGGKVLMTCPGVREAESFRYAILQATAAWGPLIGR